MSLTGDVTSSHMWNIHLSLGYLRFTQRLYGEKSFNESTSLLLLFVF